MTSNDNNDTIIPGMQFVRDIVIIVYIEAFKAMF